VSSTEGGFVLTNSSPVQHVLPQQTSFEKIKIENNGFLFSIEGRDRVVFSVFTLQGRRCFEKKIDNVTSGSYHIGLQSIVPSSVKSGTYIVSIVTGSGRAASKVIHQSGKGVADFKLSKIDGVSQTLRLARQLETVDIVTISKLGYVTKSIEIESYQQNLGDIILEKSAALGNAEAISRIEDSLVNLFINRIQMIENLEGPDELKTIDYISIRNGFEAILAIDSMRVKSNIGFMVSALASLNTNPKIWKIIDSLDAFFSSFDEEPLEGGAVESAQEIALFKRAMQKGGVVTLGKVLAAKTPQILTASVQHASFPKFLTISYLQKMIEADLLPVLTPILYAAERLESLDDASMQVTVDEDQFEIDKGEIYLFDAYIHLARAYATLLCIYDMDLYTEADKQDYSWIDTMVNADDNGKTIYTISGDTLFRIEAWGDKEMVNAMVKTIHYNLESRSSFMTIRRPFHASVFADLQAIPGKIKSGLAAINAETDDQENDLLKISMIDSANADMLDFSGEMRDEGFSASFAENFSSIDKLMDFISEVLSGPYTFSETIDGKEVTVTINLTAYYTNPVEDLRSLLPYYTWTNEEEWLPDEVDTWTNSFYNRTIIYNGAEEKSDTLYYLYVYEDEDVEMRFDNSYIDSIATNEWGSKQYYLNTPIKYEVTVDSSFYFNALQLTDESGTVIDFETIDELIENRMFFPYFKDYTFNGLFPDMTRDKWLDLIWSE
jgi:hypothetical protein